MSALRFGFGLAPNLPRRRQKLPTQLIKDRLPAAL
jgi:hypothetical protein